MNKTRPEPARWPLVLLALAFLAPAIVAVILGNLGWSPGTKSFGEPILPQRSFKDVTVNLANGEIWAWRDVTPRMTLIALAGPTCAQTCAQQLALMRNARITLHDDQHRLRLLYLGPTPASGARRRLMADWQRGHVESHAFAQWRPHDPDSVAALWVESNGTALMYYPPGFDVNGLRKDLGQVIR